MSDQYLEMQLDSVKRRLARIEAHLGIGPPPGAGTSELVAQLAREGKTLEAIRLHRDETGCDLATAKAAVAAVGPG